MDGAAFALYDAANKLSSVTGGSVSHRANGAINAFSNCSPPETRKRHLYQYVEGNPVWFADPDGFEAITIGGGFGMASTGVAGAAGAAGAAVAAVGTAAGIGGAYVGSMGLLCQLDPEGSAAAAEYYWDLPPGSCSLPSNWMAAGHTKGARGSTKEKHEKGDTRRGKDAGGEKGDVRRGTNRKRPKNHKGSWPPEGEVSRW